MSGLDDVCTRVVVHEYRVVQEYGVMNEYGVVHENEWCTRTSGAREVHEIT